MKEGQTRTDYGYSDLADVNFNDQKITQALIEQQLQSFVSPYLQFSDHTIEATLKYIKVRKGSRGSFLWRENEYCREFVIITKGCTRLYFLAKGAENAIWFGFPNNLGSELQSFVSGQPSKFFVEVIEDLEYLSINKKAFDLLLSTHEEWQLLIRKLW